jgi:hypothetical protein
MFSCDLKEKHEIKICINDISPLTMKRIIDYAYSGNLEITVENAQSMLAAASLFEYPKIVDACCDFLRKHLHCSNCLGIEHFAHLHSCELLRQAAHLFVLDNFSSVIEQEEFMDLPFDRLQRYLSSDLIDVRCESIVYESVVKWLEYDIDHRRHDFPGLLEKVRLTTVNVTYLNDIISHDSLVRSSERCKELVEDAKKFHETVTDRVGQRRRSMQCLPRPSTVAKEVMVLIGGLNTYMLQSIEMYEPMKDKWCFLPDIPQSISWFSATALQNNIYVTGGIVDGHIVSTVWVFDSSNRTWAEGSPMLNTRARHASACLDDKLYIIGGINLVEKIISVESIECYDLKTNQWTFAGQCPFPRKLSHVVPFNSTLVELGGLQGDVKVKTIESYLCTDTSIRYSGEQFILSDAIQFSQIVVLDNIFFIIWEDSKMVISLNPEKRTFRRLPDMQYPHIHSGAVVLNDKIYVSGGLIDSKPSRIIEVYDPELDQWSIGKSMKNARACHGAVTICM